MTVSYGGPPILENIDVDVPVGSVMGLLGPNGAGKSTLLNAALGLIPRSSGTVTFFDKPLKESRSRIAHMPQTAKIDLDYPITVEGVVRMGVFPNLGWFKRPGKEEHQAIAEAIERMGLTDHRNHQISELSGGQLKRTFLARVLAQKPDFYLLDEPFAGVDVVSGKVIQRELKKLADTGATIILVHHDLGTVREICSHVTLVNRSVVANGPVEQAFTPELVGKAFGLGLADLGGSNDAS
ncbi:metal ABC transporter ATP-binding protein [Corynebacterium sp. TAE3-ERU12]|uniref:metal ABC transporter ATP-binding protein n=1 Tax=Corynebacterium sp. TAE3-ERU12 TaxID=2849491 RepID=UPI001C46DFA8|nr:metal ABC transporter ATP-binding protein [Corynebacterium sp. TAE3-ERU12]MBV7295918.1 metal ABC transporter ATP-binding protein [Corynebacterium sp. TAE3-ERU12]